jgi:cellulase/cellobiase CelA1
MYGCATHRCVYTHTHTHTPTYRCTGALQMCTQGCAVVQCAYVYTHTHHTDAHIHTTPTFAPAYTRKKTDTDGHKEICTHHEALTHTKIHTSACFFQAFFLNEFVALQKGVRVVAVLELVTSEQMPMQHLFADHRAIPATMSIIHRPETPHLLASFAFEMLTKR